MCRSFPESRFERLQWTFALAVTLHNLEEAIWLPSWVARHRAALSGPVTATHFRLALVALTMAAYLVTWRSVQKGRQSGWTSLFVAYTFAMFLNVFVPHVPASFLFRGYTPGLVTAVLINLPVTTILLTHTWRERIIPNRARAVFVFGLPLGLAAGAAVFFTAQLR